jgi:hypothetical protein
LQLAAIQIIFIAEPTVMSAKQFLFFLLAGTLVMIIVMRWHGKPLTQTPSAKAGIVSLEFAKSKHKANTIVQEWKRAPGADLKKHAINNTWIDFIFILFYSLFLYSACYYFSLKQKKAAASFLRAVALLGLTAGLLDAVENYFLFQMLNEQITNTQALLTFWLAAFKFSLAGICVLCILVMFLNSVFSTSKNKIV